MNKFKEQDRMFVAIESHMRDKGETNTPSPILFSRHSVAMLSDGLIEHHEKVGLRSSSTQSYLYICFRPDDGRLVTLIILFIVYKYIT